MIAIEDLIKLIQIKQMEKDSGQVVISLNRGTITNVTEKTDHHSLNMRIEQRKKTYVIRTKLDQKQECGINATVETEPIQPIEKPKTLPDKE